MKSIDKMSPRELRLEVSDLRSRMDLLQNELYEIRELIGPAFRAPIGNQSEPFLTLYPYFDYRDQDQRFVKPLPRPNIIDLDKLLEVSS